MTKQLTLFLIFTGLITTQATAEIIGSVTYNSKNYFVDVIKSSASDQTKVEIWFRTANNASSLDDLKITELKAYTKKLSEYVDLVCRGKEIWDAGKTIAGCTSVVGSAFCAVGTVATDGALAVVCETVWVYTEDKGAADCLEGMADALAKFVGKDKEWKLLGTAAQLTEPELAKAISTAVDMMCGDIKNKKE